jgi:stage III sporulation protein SpoIIIAA
LIRNEIAGDSDIPHSGIGRARRMQVAKTELQHQVMIEAVENHMPQVIIIDEIGTELEVLQGRSPKRCSTCWDDMGTV